jgi:hypothetical protein
MSAQPDMKRVRRMRARHELTRWLRYTTPPPSPRDVQEMLDWVDELLAENRGLRQDLLDSIERNIARIARLGLQVPACDRCTQGVMDSTNPHLLGVCTCECHDVETAA